MPRGRGSAWGVSRPMPRDRGSAQGHVQAQAQGMSRPRLGGSRPRPGGVCVCVPACTEAYFPPTRQLLLQMVHILLECILVSQACVKNSVYRGGLPPSPLGRHTPPWACTNKAGTPHARHPLGSPCWDTVNMQVVCILLECNVVFSQVSTRGSFGLWETPLDREPPDRETPGQRPPWTETLLDRDPLWTETPWTETPLGQRPPTETPSRQTPLDRDPLDRDPHPVMDGWYTSYWNAFLLRKDF